MVIYAFNFILYIQDDLGEIIFYCGKTVYFMYV